MRPRLSVTTTLVISIVAAVGCSHLDDSASRDSPISNRREVDDAPAPWTAEAHPADARARPQPRAEEEVAQPIETQVRASEGQPNASDGEHDRGTLGEIAHAPREDVAPTGPAKSKKAEMSLGLGLGRGRTSAGYGTGALAMGGQGSSSPSSASANEDYDRLVENAVKRVVDAPLSTFSIDVDTASYSNVRRFLRDGSLPPADAVRIEELVNYFDYDYSSPTDGTPFSIITEISDCPWNADRRLVHIGIQGTEIALDDAGRNFVFLLDVSGSMAAADKLPLLKRGMALLTRNLTQRDRVAIVVYAGASGVVLPSTAGHRHAEILAALEKLDAGGSTNGGQGIELAYAIAHQNFIPGGINRVILATDGDFNVGVTSRGELERLIEAKRETGTFLTVLGFGSGNLKDSQMEALADKGNGNYAYIDSMREAHKVLVREAGSTLVTIAKDVKLQVEFNPARVVGYRLVGYENRVLANEDFANDRKDAGEIGAGHSVTAMYEIELAHGTTASSSIPLEYQTPRALSANASRAELATVKVRYKQPSADASTLLSRPIVDADLPLERSSNDFRFAAAVAAFGMLLRDSAQAKDVSFRDVAAMAKSALGRDTNGDRREFLALIQQAAALQSRHANDAKDAKHARPDGLGRNPLQ